MQIRKKFEEPHFKQKHGFYSDERIDAVQAVGVRRMYWLMTIFLPLTGAYQQLVNGHPHAFPITAGTVFCSALFLLGYRLYLGGLAAADERTAQRFGRGFRWTGLFIIFCFLTYFAWLIFIWPEGPIHNPASSRSMWLWLPSLLLSSSGVIITHLRRETYPAQVWKNQLGLGWRLGWIIGLLLGIIMFFVGVLLILSNMP